MAANPSTPSAELTLRTEKNGDEAAVYGSGRITSSTSAQLQNTVRELIPQNKRILLDLTNVNYIDSSGIGAMVSVCLAANRQECELKVVNAQPRIRDLFEITKLSTVFENQGGYRGLKSDQ
ncbi:MAG: anti-sigma factor antagonist [Acidobacteria bacterium]|nr:MAG: anti-sigma factor antagonist [Acidobacteriota bacterium]